MDTARGRTFITDLWNDLVVTLRALRRAPQLTTAVVLTLALGIGASFRPSSASSTRCCCGRARSRTRNAW